MNDRTLERIADALERIASAMNSKAAKPAPVNNDILTTRIDDILMLSGRAKKVCHNLDIATVMDLCGWTRSGIISQPGVGKMTFNELDRLLRRNGHNWGTWQSPSFLNATGRRA